MNGNSGNIVILLFVLFMIWLNRSGRLAAIKTVISGAPTNAQSAGTNSLGAVGNSNQLSSLPLLNWLFHTPSSPQTNGGTSVP